ncbi:hypothetical protein N752_02840 [Desulforamulus aquiferis]|nr:hypothetical protein N752_02840 [Desulforamulus aquiferis]
MICEQINRGNKVIQELLDFGRPSKPIVSPTDINRLVESVLTFTSPMLRQNNVALEKILNNDLPLADVDSDRVKQVFVNLILNAVQAMPKGGKLSISTTTQGSSVQIDFSDTGTGIKDHDLPRIFDPFYTTKDDGAGLGLSISHQIVHLHGGNIWVSNTSSAGTVISVSFPQSGRGLIGVE